MARAKALLSSMADASPVVKSNPYPQKEFGEDKMDTERVRNFK